MYFAIVLTL